MINNNYSVNRTTINNSNEIDFANASYLNVVDPNSAIYIDSKTNLLNFNQVLCNVTPTQINTSQYNPLTIFVKRSNTIIPPSPQPDDTVQYDNLLIGISADLFSIYTTIGQTTVIPTNFVLYFNGTQVIWYDPTNIVPRSINWDTLINTTGIYPSIISFDSSNNPQLINDVTVNFVPAGSISNNMIQNITYNKISNSSNSLNLVQNAFGTPTDKQILQYSTGSSSLNWQTISITFSEISDASSNLTRLQNTSGIPTSGQLLAYISGTSYSFLSQSSLQIIYSQISNYTSLPITYSQLSNPSSTLNLIQNNNSSPSDKQILQYSVIGNVLNWINPNSISPQISISWSQITSGIPPYFVYNGASKQYITNTDIQNQTISISKLSVSTPVYPEMIIALPIGIGSLTTYTLQTNSLFSSTGTSIYNITPTSTTASVLCFTGTTNQYQAQILFSNLPYPITHQVDRDQYLIWSQGSLIPQYYYPLQNSIQYYNSSYQITSQAITQNGIMIGSNNSNPIPDYLTSSQNSLVIFNSSGIPTVKNLLANNVLITDGSGNIVSFNNVSQYVYFNSSGQVISQQIQLSDISSYLIFSNIGGVATLAQLPVQNSSTKKYLQSVSSASPTYQQVSFTDLTSTISNAQISSNSISANILYAPSSPITRAYSIIWDNGNQNFHYLSSQQDTSDGIPFIAQTGATLQQNWSTLVSSSNGGWVYFNGRNPHNLACTTAISGSVLINNSTGTPQLLSGISNQFVSFDSSGTPISTSIQLSNLPVSSSTGKYVLSSYGSSVCQYAQLYYYDLLAGGSFSNAQIFTFNIGGGAVLLSCNKNQYYKIDGQGQISGTLYDATNTNACYNQILGNASNWNCLTMTNNAPTYKNGIAIPQNGSEIGFFCCNTSASKIASFWLFNGSGYNPYDNSNIYAQECYISTLGAYVVTSDRRVKTLIDEDISDENIIKCLSKKKIRRYTYKKDKNQSQRTGYFAQDLQDEFFSDCVCVDPSEETLDQMQDKLYVDQTQFTSTLYNAIVQISKKCIKQEELINNLLEVQKKQQQQIDNLLSKKRLLDDEYDIITI